jgi:hypothetical protein
MDYEDGAAKRIRTALWGDYTAAQPHLLDVFLTAYKNSMHPSNSPPIGVGVMAMTCLANTSEDTQMEMYLAQAIRWAVASVDGDDTALMVYNIFQGALMHYAASAHDRVDECVATVMSAVWDRTASLSAAWATHPSLLSEYLAMCAFLVIECAAKYAESERVQTEAMAFLGRVTDTNKEILGLVDAGSASALVTSSHAAMDAMCRFPNTTSIILNASRHLHAVLSSGLLPDGAQMNFVAFIEDPENWAYTRPAAGYSTKYHPSVVAREGKAISRAFSGEIIEIASGRLTLTGAEKRLNAAITVLCGLRGNYAGFEVDTVTVDRLEKIVKRGMVPLHRIGDVEAIVRECMSIGVSAAV